MICLECGTSSDVRGYLVPGWAAPVPLCYAHAKTIVEPTEEAPAPKESEDNHEK